MSKQLTAKKVFQSFDVNGDGKLSRDEYSQALNKMKIPKEICDIVTNSVFARFDSDKDDGIDEDEFVKYFNDEMNVALHERLDRNVFANRFQIIWAIYFMMIAGKLLSDPRAFVLETFPGIIKTDEAAHLTIILGCSFLTSGIMAMLQSDVFGLSGVAAYAFAAMCWSTLTLYETFVGSIAGVESFVGPPTVVTVLSIIVSIFGLWSMQVGKSKMKET